MQLYYYMNLKIKKILEEISFEFHLRKESFLVKDLKDYEKLIIKNMFMSALINNDLSKPNERYFEYEV